MTWPDDGVDAVVTRIDGDLIPAADFNNQDSQIRGIQEWLGDGNGELLGDDGIPAHGPGGLASSTASGGTAVKLAAKKDYSSGKLLSVGDALDVAYSEKFSIDFSGKISSDGLHVSVDGALADPGNRDTVQTVISGGNTVGIDCRNGFVVYHKLTENTVVQVPSHPTNGAELTFIIKGSGSLTIDFDYGGAGTFWYESAFPMAVGSLKHLVVKFIYELTLGGWIEEWSNLVTTGIA